MANIIQNLELNKKRLMLAIGYIESIETNKKLFNLEHLTEVEFNEKTNQLNEDYKKVISNLYDDWNLINDNSNGFKDVFEELGEIFKIR